MASPKAGWYFATNEAKHARQVVVHLPASAKVKPCVDNLVIGDLNLAGPTNWSIGLAYVGNKGPYVFAKADGPMVRGESERVVDKLGGCPARVVFAFYHLDTDGLFQVFVDVDSPVVKERMGYPYLTERVLELGDQPNCEVIEATIRRDKLELCIVAGGEYGPLTGHHGLAVELPREVRDVLKREWQELKEHRGRRASPNFDIALAQYNRENPMPASPILDEPPPKVKEKQPKAEKSPKKKEKAAASEPASSPPPALEPREPGAGVGTYLRRLFVMACVVGLGWLAWGQEAPPQVPWMQPALDVIQQGFDDAGLTPQLGRAFVGAGAGGLLAFLLCGGLWRPRRWLALIVVLGLGAGAGWALSQGAPAEWLAHEFNVHGFVPIVLVSVAAAALLLGLYEWMRSPIKSGESSKQPTSFGPIFRRLAVPVLMAAGGWLTWGQEAPPPWEAIQPVLDAIQFTFDGIPLEPDWARALVGVGIAGLIAYILGGALLRGLAFLGMVFVLGFAAGLGWLATTEWLAEWTTSLAGIEGLIPMMAVCLAGGGALLGLYEWLRPRRLPKTEPAKPPDSPNNQEDLEQAVNRLRVLLILRSILRN